MLLRSLRLNGLLSFRDTIIDFRPLNVIIGTNSSGKSNLITSLRLLQSLPEQGAFENRLQYMRDPFWLGDDNENAEIGAEFEFRDGELLALKFGFRFTATGFAITHERLAGSVEYFNRTSGGVLSIVGGAGTAIGLSKPALAAYRQPNDPTPVTALGDVLGQIRFYSRFDTGPDSRIRTGIIERAVAEPLREDGVNLAAVLLRLSRTDRWREIEGRLQQFLPRVQHLQVKSTEGALHISAEERGLAKPVPAERISDGTLQFLCLLAVLADEAPAPLVCIEEPETGLHPDALRIVADILKEASLRTQVIVTTHSSALVDALSDQLETIVVCERDFDEGTTFVRLSREKLAGWLDDYSLGELWRKGEIGGTIW